MIAWLTHTSTHISVHDYMCSSNTSCHDSWDCELVTAISYLLWEKGSTTSIRRFATPVSSPLFCSFSQRRSDFFFCWTQTDDWLQIFYRNSQIVIEIYNNSSSFTVHRINLINSQVSIDAFDVFVCIIMISICMGVTEGIFHSPTGFKLRRTSLSSILNARWILFLDFNRFESTVTNGVRSYGWEERSGNWIQYSGEE